jgi:DNA helicase TIP49 (TBP-interacting protein)
LHYAVRNDTITLRLFNVIYFNGGHSMSAQRKHSPMNFKTMSVPEVPQGRNGKHKQIVTQILSDLDQVQEGMALKVPLADLAESKEKVRSALNRATRKARLNVITASDGDFLYVWNEAKKPAAG